MLDSAALRARLADVRDRIARAAGRARRDPASIRLVAISKTFDPPTTSWPPPTTGQVDFGENKVQEGLQKMDANGRPCRSAGIWSATCNRTRPGRPPPASTPFTRLIPSSLLRKLDQAAAAAGRTIELLVQVDLAGEPTKHGARADELLAIFDAAARLSRRPPQRA